MSDLPQTAAPILPLTRAVSILGGQAATARLLEVSAGLVWQWLNGSPLPPKYCPPIETATAERGELIACEDLLPDVSWVRAEDNSVRGYVVTVVPTAEEGADADPDAGRIVPAVETA